MHPRGLLLTFFSFSYREAYILPPTAVFIMFRERYFSLRALYDPDAKTINIPGSDLELHHFPFSSAHSKLLPGADSYTCEEHGLVFKEDLDSRIRQRMDHYPETLKHTDIGIGENRDFTYAVFKKAVPARADDVIFLFHGLNEHSWLKYLPWAEQLVGLTGKAVILFPIAFHMNRTPVEWGNSRPMNSVSGIRHRDSAAVLNSSFANAAISTRIETIPQRFFWSGLQTFDDIVRLISEIRGGSHPLIAPGAGIDLFAYSIGSFLSEILLMANPEGYFADSRLFMFCGGPTLDRMSPNSKFILDSDATIALYSFYTERLEAELQLDRRIAHYFSDAHPAGTIFRMMLSYRKEKKARERHLRRLQDRLHAVALRKDDVIPATEVLNTLKGEYRDIGTRVDVLDFPYPYTHINPFPTDETHEHLVDSCFRDVFSRAAEHLR